HKKLNRLWALVENQPYQVRFFDEIIADDNGKVHEINPGYYGEFATWKIIDGSIWSQGEAQDNPTAYVNALLGNENGFQGASDRWLTDEQIREQGFTLFDYEAESGF